MPRIDDLLRVSALPERTRRFLDGGEVAEGQRNAELYAAAQQLYYAGVPEGEAKSALLAAAQSRGLQESEALGTVKSAYKGQVKPAARAQKPEASPRRQLSRVPQIRISSGDSSGLPSPITDDPIRKLLRAAFMPNEGVSIVKAAKEDGEDKEHVVAGPVLSLEEWLKRCDRQKGLPYLVGSDPAGVFIRINPMRLGGTKDEDVADFRHVLVEFDKLSLEEQWRLIRSTDLPCTAVIFSGNKSLHAWVRVDARHRREYDERVKVIWERFRPYGIDEQNRTPGRHSRVPGYVRGDTNKRQELLAVNIGLSSWSAWAIAESGRDLPKVMDLASIESFDAENDPDCLLGQRWLCKGGSLLIVGMSGIGKSSFVMQGAITWALGRDLFGIRPKREMRSLVFQAENDSGDIAEMLQGISFGMELSAVDMFDVYDRVLIVRESARTSQDFLDLALRMIQYHRPDLVWADPLMSFIGGDISKQEVVAAFLRNGLTPILEQTGVAWIWMHHTGKPPKQDGGRSGWDVSRILTDSDYSYMGLGSSDITNWARAICVLEQVKGAKHFCLRLTKRGKRAGLVWEDGTPRNEITLLHGAGQIVWLEKPQESVETGTIKLKQAAPKKAVPEAKPIPTAAEFAELCLKEPGDIRRVKLNAAREKIKFVEALLDEAISKGLATVDVDVNGKKTYRKAQSSLF